jgi:hypothetical protein
VRATTTVEVAGDQAVVVKRAPSGSAERLRREGERLRRAIHPGVVPVVRSLPAGEGWVLVTGHAGRPLSTLDRPSAARAARIAASLASTVADLHDLGVVHGRIEASHVLLGDNDRPVLCGLGDGVQIADPADDVAAIGLLLTELTGPDDGGEPIPDRRWRWRRPHGGWERQALLAIADQAMAEPPSRRPSARRLASAIAAAVPDATVDEVPPPAIDQPETDPIERLRPAADPVPKRARVRPMLIAVAGVGFLIGGASHLRDRGQDPADVLAEPMRSASSTVTDPSAEDLDVRTAAVAPGSVLVRDGRGYRVGQPGDHLLVDDWRCDGVPTPAVFRPSTGEVFVFDTWTATEPLEVHALARVSGGVALESRRTGGGCPSLAVRTTSGASTPVVLGVVP